MREEEPSVSGENATPCVDGVDCDVVRSSAGEPPVLAKRSSKSIMSARDCVAAPRGAQERVSLDRLEPRLDRRSTLRS